MELTLGAKPLRRLDVPAFPTADRIPPLLHQTFRTRDLNPELATSVQTMRRNNPDWDYRFYDDADVRAFILNTYGDEFLDYFQALNPKYAAARADLFRYLLMYREGGVYLDIKSHAAMPLSEVIQPSDRFLISQWRNDRDGGFAMWGFHSELKGVEGGEFQQWFIATAPGHPFLKATIERVLHNIRRYHPLTHSVGKPAVLRTTGPIAYTRAIAPLLPLHPHRMVDSDRDLGFQYSIYPRQDHEAALGAHYSEIAEALVGDDPVTLASAAVRRSIRQLRHETKQRLQAQEARAL
jgi:hypothetical protein